jgi:MoaA/NifB/PqqE/SkfB family radical SAM enzyme
MLRKVYLEISNLCNLRCSFCPGTRREKRMLSTEEFRLLAEKLRGHTEYLYFHLMGEPLLHPQLPELLAISGELGFRVMITTNGTLLRERGEALLASGAVHKVNLSLQSFEANAPGDLSAYVRSCADFVKRAARQGILCEFRLWNQGGLETRNREITALLEECFPPPWSESRNGRKLAERVWLDPGERFDWPNLELDEVRETGFCYGLRDQIGVLCDGTVVPCCLDHEGDIPLGNLFMQELDEILESPRARAIYEGFSQRRVIEALCRRCGYAKRFQK